MTSSKARGDVKELGPYAADLGGYYCTDRSEDEVSVKGRIDYFKKNAQPFYVGLVSTVM